MVCWRAVVGEHTHQVLIPPLSSRPSVHRRDRGPASGAANIPAAPEEKTSGGPGGRGHRQRDLLIAESGGVLTAPPDCRSAPGSRDLPCGDVEAVEHVGRRDREDQGRERLLVIVPGGLVPD